MAKSLRILVILFVFFQMPPPLTDARQSYFNAPPPVFSASNYQKPADQPPQTLVKVRMSLRILWHVESVGVLIVFFSLPLVPDKQCYSDFYFIIICNIFPSRSPSRTVFPKCSRLAERAESWPPRSPRRSRSHSPMFLLLAASSVPECPRIRRRPEETTSDSRTWRINRRGGWEQVRE